MYIMPFFFEQKKSDRFLLKLGLFRHFFFLCIIINIELTFLFQLLIFYPQQKNYVFFLSFVPIKKKTAGTLLMIWKKGSNMHKNNLHVSPLIWYNGQFNFFINTLLHPDSPLNKNNWSGPWEASNYHTRKYKPPAIFCIYPRKILKHQ